MKHFTAVIERDADTGLYVGWVPGFRHSTAAGRNDAARSFDGRIATARGS